MSDAVRPAEINHRDPLGVLTVLALVIALAAVATRMTVMELARTGLDIAPAADLDGGGPGVTTTLLLDALCGVPAVLVLLRRAVDRAYVLRWNVSHVLLLVLVAWITLSASWASNKFDALVSAGTWWAAASLYWAAGQLVRSWTRLRPVLGLAAGLLLVFVAQAVIYRFYELPDVRDYWQKQREELIQRQGRAADDFLIQRFDLNLANGIAQGFFRSPNTFAAIATLCALVTAGLAAQRLLDRDEPLFPGVLGVGVVGLPVVLYWTQSRTAWGVAALALAALPLAWVARGWLARHARPAYWTGAGVVAVGLVAVVGLGLKTGGLLHDSLTFRWHYWVASWNLFKSRPLLGVGWTNFGNAYLPYRLPVAAEEIKDPHNLFVRFATETGAVGLLLAVAWVGRLLWEATRPVTPRVPPTTPATAATASLTAWNPLGAFLGVVVAFLMLRTAVLWPLSLSPSELIKTPLFAVLLLAGLLVSTVRDTTVAHADERPAPLALYAVIVGLLGFLLHNNVDFAAFETGPLLMLMLLAGAVVGVRHPGVAGRKTHTAAALAGLTAVFVGGLAAAGLWAVPVVMAETKAAAADAVGRGTVPGVNGRPGQARDLYAEAERTVPVANPEYPQRALQWTADATPEAVLAVLSQWIAADPANPRAWLERGRFQNRLKAGSPGALVDLAAAVARTPTDPTVRLEYAAALDAGGQTTEATEQYRQALASNDRLNKDEPRRLPAKRVTEVQARLGK